MPITVSCTKCGKKLSVRDELVGKKLKCPACGATFDAKAGGNVMPRAGAVRSTAPAVTVSTGLIIGVGAAVLVVVALLIFVFGPMAAWKAWEKLGDDPNQSVSEVVTLGLKSYLSETGSWNPRKSGSTPHTNDDTVFIRDMFVMSMPASVPFKGTTTQGNFSGKYHPKTGEVEADVGVGGTNLGGVTVKEGGKTIHVTGRMKNGVVTAEVDGRNAEIHYPPEEDK